jgi:regulator of protease activity HflC (stomatin/prohibitin superfamily)
MRVPEPGLAGGVETLMAGTNNVTSFDRRRPDGDRHDPGAARRRRMTFNVGGVVALLVLALVFVSFFSLFTVPQTSQALVVRLGDPIRTISEPGLHMKMPFVDSVIYVDNRILDLESASEEVIASDQKRLVVEAFARYRISNPLQFYQTVGTIDGANSRLSPLLNAALRRVLGDFTLTQALRDDRPALMARVRTQLDTEARSLGIEVVDVRISRANLPMQNSQAVYQRMQTERQREAAEFRAQGNEKSQEIRARADRDVTAAGRAGARRRRCRPGPNLRGCLRKGPGVLRVLSLHAGLRSRTATQQHAAGAAAGLAVLPVLQRSLRGVAGEMNRAKLPLATARCRATRLPLAVEGFPAARPRGDVRYRGAGGWRVARRAAGAGAAAAGAAATGSVATAAVAPSRCCCSSARSRETFLWCWSSDSENECPPVPSATK